MLVSLVYSIYASDFLLTAVMVLLFVQSGLAFLGLLLIVHVGICLLDASLWILQGLPSIPVPRGHNFSHFFVISFVLSVFVDHRFGELGVATKVEIQ